MVVRLDLLELEVDERVRIERTFLLDRFLQCSCSLVTALKAHNNNRSQTVLDLFLNAIAEHGCPSRVRGDHGVENLLVAEFMDINYGHERGSYIWGR